MFGVRRRVRELAGRIGERLRPVPHGDDVFRDIERCTGRETMKVVFDVGANIGQSTGRYHRTFPEASIFAFEPVRETFARLQEAFQQTPGVRCFHQAMGEEVGEVTIVLEENSTQNSLLNAATEPAAGKASAGAAEGSAFEGTAREGTEPPGRGDMRTETLNVGTVDAFCREMGITDIDFMKVDTEGFDLAVMRGAEAMLRDQKIAYVQAEVGMGSHNRKHVPLHVMQAHLEERGYALFGIYEQTPEWWNKLARLRFCNAVFICEAELSRARPGMTYRC